MAPGGAGGAGNTLRGRTWREVVELNLARAQIARSSSVISPNVSLVWKLSPDGLDRIALCWAPV